jgi:hypothetical protein
MGVELVRLLSSSWWACCCLSLACHQMAAYTQYICTCKQVVLHNGVQLKYLVTNQRGDSFKCMHCCNAAVAAGRLQWHRSESSLPLPGHLAVGSSVVACAHDAFGWQ